MTNPFADTSTRTYEHCGTLMKLVEEHAVPEQYTRQTW
jgi:hypothetical protein